jgi:hypothetical protein
MCNSFMACAILFSEVAGDADALTGVTAQPTTVPAHVPVTLEVLKQSYFNKIGVQSIVPTNTLHSVTPKHLLLSTASDQVCMACSTPTNCFCRQGALHMLF